MSTVVYCWIVKDTYQIIVSPMHNIVPLEFDWWERNEYIYIEIQSISSYDQTTSDRILQMELSNVVIVFAVRCLYYLMGTVVRCLLCCRPLFCQSTWINNNSTRVVIVWGVTKCLLVHISFPRYLCIFRGFTLKSRPHGTRWSSVILTRRWWF